MRAVIWADDLSISANLMSFHGGHPAQLSIAVSHATKIPSSDSMNDFWSNVKDDVGWMALDGDIRPAEGGVGETRGSSNPGCAALGQVHNSITQTALIQLFLTFPPGSRGTEPGRTIYG
jgi:hypothetical protein